MTVRDATVGPESGTLVVLGFSKATLSIGTRAASAASWRKTVSVPWPMSVEASDAEPPPVSRSIRTLPLSFRSPEPVKPAPCRNTLAPIPRRTRPFGLRCTARASRAYRARAIARVTHSSTPTLSRSA